MATDQLTYSGTLVLRTCWCGIRHSIPDELDRMARGSKGFKVYCPLGHAWIVGKNDAERLADELEAEKATATRLRARLDQEQAATLHERNRANGYKGAMTQAKQRASKGVCPVPGCKRHFVDVERHVASKHPDYVAGV